MQERVPNGSDLVFTAENAQDDEEQIISAADWFMEFFGIRDALAALCSGTCAYNTPLSVTRGPNLFCPTALTPLTASRATVETAITAMNAGGDTEIPLGLEWSWRLLSPKWRGIWNNEMNTNSLPLDYSTTNMSKVVILMTDGDNQIHNGLYSAYGTPKLTKPVSAAINNFASGSCTTNTFGGLDCANAFSYLNDRTAAVCTAMKAQGIIIYTIALGTAVSSTGQDLLKNCASDPAHYFLSPTTSELNTIFKKIGDSLANLYISQ